MEYIKIGAIAGTHGLRGEVSVKSFTQFNDIRFAKGNIIFRETSSGMQELKIVSMRQKTDRILLQLAGYDHIEQVEAWKGSLLYIQKDQLHELDEDEVYYFELMHCQVVDMEGRLLGEVSDLIETGSSVVLRVSGNKEILIPYVKAFVKEADIAAKRIVVELLEGMV
jgi:16S rRNA processing protein RimM